MALNYLSRFEDPNHPLLGPNICRLQYCGLWQPNRFQAYFYNTVHIFAAIFLIRQYAELWIVRNDLEVALRNLSYTMLNSVCVFKAATFVFWQKSWTELIEFVSYLERSQLAKNDRKTNTIIGDYMKYSRKLTCFYWCLVTATVFTVIMAPLFGFLSSADHRERIRNGTSPYPEILSCWVPFDRTRGFGYWISCFENSLLVCYGGGIVASYDTNAAAIMSFFTGQLDLLSVNCAGLFGDEVEGVSHVRAMKRIKECHNHHSNLIKFSTIFNSLLSPVMFLYVLICSLMICASAVQLTMESTSSVQRVWVAEYVVALVSQLFLYCWHSNEVLYMSNTVENSVHSSAWWSQNVRMRRCVILLGGKLRKPIVFTAGPFTQLNLAAFVTILKGAYSYYTLLSKNED